MKPAIFGAGMMARAVVHELLARSEVSEVRVADRDRSRLTDFRRRFPGQALRTSRFDAEDRQATMEFISGCDVVVSCVPYMYNLRLTEAAIAARVHFCDLGGNNDVVNRQLTLDSRARRADVAVVPDCGLAPGLVSIIAADALTRLDRCDAIRLRVGGLPRRPRPPLNYAIVFSANGLVNEYVEPCEVLRNGKPATVPPLADLEVLRFAPLGRLEAFNTSGGVSTLTRTLRGKVRDLDYKTIRYPGHCAKFRLLFELGLTDSKPVAFGEKSIAPRTVLIHQLESVLGFEQDDIVLVRVDATGTRQGRPTRIRYRLFDRADKQTGLTAMMRCTGFPAAIAALTLGRGKARRAGVLPGELAFTPGPYLAELRERGVRLTIRSGQARPVQPPRPLPGRFARSELPKESG